MKTEAVVKGTRQKVASVGQHVQWGQSIDGVKGKLLDLNKVVSALKSTIKKGSQTANDHRIQQIHDYCRSAQTLGHCVVPVRILDCGHVMKAGDHTATLYRFKIEKQGGPAIHLGTDVFSKDMFVEKS